MLDNVTIKSKLWFNFGVMALGVFFICLVTVLQMVHFKDILHELLYVAGRQNVDYKQAQVLIAQLEGYFHMLRNAEDAKAIAAVETGFLKALGHLDISLTHMNQTAKIPPGLLESSKVFSELFDKVRLLKAANIELDSENKRLQEIIAQTIGRDKRALATILDNNELLIFQAEEKLKTSHRDVASQIRELLHHSFAPFKSGLDIVNYLNELEIVATRAAGVSDLDYLDPLREKIIAALQPIDRHLAALDLVLRGEDRTLLRSVLESMPQVKAMLLGDSGLIERQRQIAQAHNEYDRVLQATVVAIATISGHADVAAQSIDTDAKYLGERTTQALSSIVTSVSIFFVGLLAFGGCLSLFIIRSIVRPLDQGVAFAQAIAAGNLDASLNLDQTDEVGSLAAALNDMAGKLRRQDWLRAGKASLNDRMRGEQDMQALANNVLRFVAAYVDAHLGAFYILDPEEDTLRLFASYAVLEPGKLPLELRLGQGLAGQAALERRPIVLENTPEGYALVGSSLGAAQATFFMAIPLTTGEVVRAVVELGGLHDFSSQQHTFLKQIEENIAIAIETAQSRERVRRLLHRTQEQAGKLASQQRELRSKNDALEEQTGALRESEASLQQQQEELRVTNEELEEQTKALKEYHSTLHAQQEELRVANEELAERTRELEQQRDAVQKKNLELVHAQIEIERKAKEIELASKYKSEFMANMSHELRTPLNSILILAQVMAANKDGNLSDKQLEYAKTIQTSGVDLLALINEILDLAKVEAGKMQAHSEDLCLAELTEGLYRIFQPMAVKNGLMLTMDIAADLPPTISADPQRLQQVLRNLLSNAIKFTDSGGVSLNIHRPEPGVSLGVSGLRPQDAIAFTVSDTGVGIAENKQALIFEAFQQADGATTRKYGGTGLGLSIAREMARILGGEIRLQSHVGKGSSFTLYLPGRCGVAATPEFCTLDGALAPDSPSDVSGDWRAERFAAQAAQESRHEPATQAFPEHYREHSDIGQAAEGSDANGPDAFDAAFGSTPSFVHDDRRNLRKGDRSLLIIGEDQEMCEKLRDIAHERGFKTLIAENGESGLHFADYYTPSAIILDLSPPAMDGWQVMERLKQSTQTRHIPVHFLSASDLPLSSLKMGSIGFLKKPLHQDELENAFKRIEEIVSRPLKRLLLVEDNDAQRLSIAELVGDTNVNITAVASAEEAYGLLQSVTFDCMILDLGLSGEMSGADFLAAIREDSAIPKLPVIIYTGRDLSKQEEALLSRYAESIIIKGAHAPERLLNEATLFLHRVEAELPSEKRRALRMIHDKEAALKEKTVLLVDDDMRNVFALASALEEKGMHVVESGDGKDCLAQLTGRDDIDLVLMDIMMPEMDGYETIKKIRETKRYGNVPIIALTAKAMKGDKAKCIDAGANDYLAKPVDIGKLLSLLRVWLHK